MQNRVSISLGETTDQILVTVDGEVICCITDIKLHVNANQLMPILHIVMAKPTEDVPQDLRNKINEQIEILNSIPYIELSLQEIKK